MGHVHVHDENVHLHDPVFVEGLPGFGLVGKIASDHLIDQFDMTYYASIECPSLPAVVSYGSGRHEPLSPVRIYADEERNLLALRADVAVSPQLVSDFASCLTNFLTEHDALPIYASGLGLESNADLDDDRSVYGIATGHGRRRLFEHEIDPPPEGGIWSGPTGALLDQARKQGFTSLGLVVETDPEFPDPEAACKLIEDGIGPISGVTVNLEPLREQIAEIRDTKQSLAARMQVSDANESSKAESLRMYH